MSIKEEVRINFSDCAGYTNAELCDPEVLNKIVDDVRARGVGAPPRLTSIEEFIREALFAYIKSFSNEELLEFYNSLTDDEKGILYEELMKLIDDIEKMQAWLDKAKNEVKQER